MTLTTSHNWIAYTSGASQTVFPYTFLVTAAGDLKVYVDRVLITTGYTVSNVGLGSGGNVTFAVGQTGGAVVLLIRDTDNTQQVNLQEGDDLPADSVEGIFDKVYAAVQDVTETAARAFGLPVSMAGSVPVMPDFNDTGIWGKALKVNAAGTGLDVFTVLASDIASPITTKGDLIQGSNVNTPERLPIGTTGQLLTVVSGKAAWATLVAYIANALIDAKGDLIVGTANDTPARKAAAANGAILTTDSTQGDGLLWTLPGATGAIARIVAGMPAYLAPGAEKEVLGIAAGVPAYVKRTYPLDRQNISVGTGANTTETVLATYTLPASTLAVVKQAVCIIAVFTTAANANTKRGRIRFGGIGGTIVADTNALALNNLGMFLEARVFRTGAATQDAVGWSVTDIASGQRAQFAQPTQTLSGTIDIVATGQNGSATANDMLCKFLEVIWLPEP